MPTITIYQHSAASGTHYTIARKGSTVWTGLSWAEESATTAAVAAIAATPAGTGRYASVVPDDADGAELRLRAGGSPAWGDPVLWTEDVQSLVRLDVRVSSRIAAGEQVDANVVRLNGQVYNLTNQPQQDINAIKAKTDKLKFNGDDEVIAEGVGGGELTPEQLQTFAAAMWANGNRTLTDMRVVRVPILQRFARQLVQGDTYGIGGRSWDVKRVNGAEWPVSLAVYAWTCQLSRDGTAALGVPCTVLGVGDDAYVRVDLTAEQTAGLEAGRWRYAIVGQKPGANQQWTLESGTVDVSARLGDEG